MKVPMQVACRQCGSSNVISCGVITEADRFCGLRLQPAWEGGTLYKCNDCYLAFRFPVHPADEYLKLYESAPESTYENSELRYDQLLVRQAILANNIAGGAILDIGCFNGALLNTLGAEFEKFGIEASEAACRICRDQGIDIVADSAEQLGSIDRKFDVICLVDVLEHVVNPFELVKIAISRLRVGGRLIISTGDASNFLWRLFGGKYWYCSFPEHISFISPEWVSNATRFTPAQLVRLTKFPHKNPNIGQSEAWIRFVGRFIKAIGENVFLTFANSSTRSPRCKLGFPGVVNDHMLVVLCRNEESSSG